MTTVAPAPILPQSLMAGAAGQGAAGIGQGLLGGLFGQLFGGVQLGAGEGLGAETGAFASLLSGNALLGGEGLDALGADAEVGSDLLGQLQGFIQSIGGAKMDALPKLGGEIQQISVAVVEIRQVTMAFESHGFNMDDITSTENLAAAFESMGIDAETAQNMAARIDEMLALVRDQLAAVLDALGVDLADMGLGESLQAVSSVETQITQVTQMVAVHVSALQTRDAAFQKTQSVAPIKDIAALVVNNKPLVSTQTGNVLAVSTDAADVMQEKLSDLLPQKPQAKPVQPHADVAAAVEKQALAPAKVAAPVVQSTAVAGMVTETQTQPRVTSGKDARRYEAVELGREIKQPSGTMVYKWQVTTAGQDVVQQFNNPAQLAAQVSGGDVMPEDVVVDDLMADLKQTSSTGKPDEVARSDSRLPFAERLMMAQKAHVTQQIGVQMRATAEQGGGAVRIQLNPEELGAVDIELTIQNGRVHGVISAERPEVLEQMARDLQLLKQGLADAGFSLGEQGMSLLLKDGSEQHDTHIASNNGQSGASENVDGTDGAGDATQRWVAPDRLLDVNI